MESGTNFGTKFQRQSTAEGTATGSRLTARVFQDAVLLGLEVGSLERFQLFIA
ncbi:MAG: hypothetical protein ACREMY_02450 [bacterium]